MNIQVLVATMHQTDFSKIREMNIQSDVIFANQADDTSFQELDFNGYKAKMITTQTRGVGINRNFANYYATGDILLFSDDDMIYYDGYADEVLKAFRDLPAADAIFFNLDFIQNGEVLPEQYHKTGKLPVWRSMRYGTAKLAIRREALLKSNLSFSSLFGGGSRYACGEDSLFIWDCFQNHLNVYTCEYTLAKCKKDTSTWFTGYDDRYFISKGALFAAMKTKFTDLLILQFAFRRRQLFSGEMSVKKALALMKKGKQEYLQNG